MRVSVRPRALVALIRAGGLPAPGRMGGAAGRPPLGFMARSRGARVIFLKEFVAIHEGHSCCGCLGGAGVRQKFDLFHCVNDVSYIFNFQCSRSVKALTCPRPPLHLTQDFLNFLRVSPSGKGGGVGTGRCLWSPTGGLGVLWSSPRPVLEWPERPPCTRSGAQAFMHPLLQLRHHLSLRRQRRQPPLHQVHPGGRTGLRVCHFFPTVPEEVRLSFPTRSLPGGDPRVRLQAGTGWAALTASWAGLHRWIPHAPGPWGCTSP